MLRASVGVTTFVFGMLHLAPGDPARLIAGRRAPESFVQQVRVELGLNRLIYIQYLDFLTDVAALDFGNSYQIQKDVPVKDILVDHFPIPLELAILGQITGILFGIPFGVLSAIKQDSLTDHLTRIGAGWMVGTVMVATLAGV